MTDPADADWQDVQTSLEGESQAFERLVRRYQPPIAAYMWRFTRDRNQWEELVQEVFVEAYLSLRTYRARAPLLNWLRNTLSSYSPVYEMEGVTFMPLRSIALTGGVHTTPARLMEVARRRAPLHP